MQQDLRGDFVAALAIPDLYAKNVGQVVAVSTEQLRYIRRKELAMQPFDIQVHDLSACQSIRYRQDFAPFRLLSGILFSGLAILIAVGIWYYGDRMPGGHIRIGAVLFLAYAGFRNLAGGRRHTLTFEFGDRRLRWKSKAGEFKVWARAVDSVLDFARNRGLYENPADVR